MVEVAAIIQARLGSHRLPGKSMMDIEGHPMLWHVIQRVREAVDCIIVATPDKQIADFAEEQGVLTYLGSEENVLDRFYQAAVKFGVKNIMRAGADCPLLDPSVIKRVVDYYLNNDFDHVSSGPGQTYPDGVGAEIFSFKALELAWKSTNDPYDREHVTPYIYHHPELFRLGCVENDMDYSSVRWTVDTMEDLKLVRDIYSYLSRQCMFGERVFGMQDILKNYYA